MQLVVGRIARAHGVGGEVSVDVQTDAPEIRYAEGSRLDTEPAERGPLTVRSARWHSGRMLVRFEEVADRTAAEALRGTLLVVDSTTSPAAADGDEDEFWDHDLIGLRAVTTDGGETIGDVTGVVHPPGSSLLVVRRTDGTEVLVPFARAIVPRVDIAGGVVEIDPPDGLFEL